MTPNPSVSRRRPWLAGLLTLISPGVGHLYALRPVRALVAFGLMIAAVALIMVTPLIPWRPLNVLLGIGGGLVVLVALILDAVLVARRGTLPAVRPWWDRWYVYAGLILLVNLAVRDPLLRAVRERLRAYRVPSRAMEPTVTIGDLLLVTSDSAGSGSVRRGDIVVFESVTDSGLIVISRVAGLPGDTLAMRGARLERNGQPVVEPYAHVTDPDERENEATRAQMARWQAGHTVGTDGALPDLNEWGPIVVPAGAVFTLGDNRSASYDGRYWGFLPVQRIVGRPAVIYYSFDPDAPVVMPALFGIRWERIGLRPGGR